MLAGGEFLWLRPRPDAGPQRLGPIRSTPILLLERRHLALWQSLLPAGATDALSPPATAVHGALARHGAMFFGDLQRVTDLPVNAVEAGLRELIAVGLVTGDGFAGLRTLLVPVALRREASRQPWRRPPAPPPGRWSLVVPAAGAPAAMDDPKLRRAAAELVAETLLERYGVVFRSVLQREARFLPPWRELAHAFRRLEARGEIRGGRFVAGFGGEQFALPEAVERLREVRHAGNQDSQVILSAADPLNLTGIVTPGDKVPAQFRNRRPVPERRPRGGLVPRRVPVAGAAGCAGRMGGAEPPSPGPPRRHAMSRGRASRARRVMLPDPLDAGRCSTNGV